MPRCLRLLLSLLLACAGPVAAAPPAPPAAPAGQVTIYRCVDAKGRLTLRDSPCAAGERQQMRTMQRPQDPPPRPTSAPAPTAPAAPALVRDRVVVAWPPQPLYECIRPDGSRYTSDSGEGNPRWVPLWTLGYPLLVPRNPLGDRVGAPPPRPGDPPLAVVYGPPPMTFVRDECHPLPQAEVCARLRDRRDEIRRRFFNAMPSERDALRVEERAINARLASDCD
ncbi:DUF4124 domain-containing protein [Vulcaniibacterium gelatinicum]|uniref:DUF4124 domain-containing protein n=1 Tax=Vulcaniibacterium gelatinicum TaxID=2598725 RepID=UPI0011CA5519|nr:DUF4124 domain-containing protein [Vulcaniibacterium gelatinicum]